MPSEALSNYMENTLHIREERQELLERGEELSEGKKDELRNLDRMKVHILDKHIFQSMANLVYFFEFIAKHFIFYDDAQKSKDTNEKLRKELTEIFEEDIKELFDMKGTGKDGIIFRRLIDNLLVWDEKDEPDNFRLLLTHILQNAVFQKINYLTLIEFGDVFANNIVQGDMGRAWAWTKLYAKRVKVDKEEPRRPFGF